jgi:hypothetical protein
MLPQLGFDAEFQIAPVLYRENLTKLGGSEHIWITMSDMDMPDIPWLTI